MSLPNPVQRRKRTEVPFYTEEERKRWFAAESIANWVVAVVLCIALVAVLLFLSPDVMVPR